MTVIGRSRGVRVQERRTSPLRWTRAKRAAFLDRLEATCNITMSCEHVGMSYAGLRQLRRRDAAFDVLVREALAAGYERLEADLLARAIAPEDGENPNEDDRRHHVVPMDDAMKLRILQQRGAGARFGERSPRAPQRSDAEVTASLLKKLDAIATAVGGVK